MARLWTSLRVAFTLLFSVGTIHPALAEGDCSKLKGLSLDLTPTEEGYLVPMSVAGTPHLFFLNFSHAYAIIDRKLAEELKLPTKDLPDGIQIGHQGVQLTQIATAPTIQLGVVTRREAEFVVRPQHYDGWGPRAEGTVGLNMLYGFDVELDLAHNKLALFLPRHCPFAPYWDHDVVGSAPFVVQPTSAISLPMVLDGKKIEAVIDTGELKSYMPLTAAHEIFELDENRLAPAGKRESGENLFDYPFKVLSAGDVTVSNPKIHIYRNQGKQCGGVAGKRSGFPRNTNECFGGGDVELGLNVLRKLRLFFVFKEKKVYFTPAEASVPAPAAPTSVQTAPASGGGAPH